MVVRRRFRSKIRILTGDYREKQFTDLVDWDEVKYYVKSVALTSLRILLELCTRRRPLFLSMKLLLACADGLILIMMAMTEPFFIVFSWRFFLCVFQDIGCRRCYLSRGEYPLWSFSKLKNVFRDRLSHIIKLHSSSHDKTSIYPWIWLPSPWVQPRLATSARCDRVELSDYVSTATILLQRKPSASRPKPSPNEDQKRARSNSPRKCEI